MATRATIKCKNCENSFYLFWHEYKVEDEIKCPYCCHILSADYNRYVQNAISSVWEANYKLRSKHADGLTDWFEIAVEEVHVPNEKFKDFQAEYEEEDI